MPRPSLLIAAALIVATAAPSVAQELSMPESMAFLKAVRERDGAAAESILSNPASSAINARDGRGEGALHILVRGRDLNWLAFLLGRGARANMQSNDGTTPLGLAAQIGWQEAAELLIARGASVDLANNRGETPLILAVHSRAGDVVRLLLAQGADPDRTDSAAGYSALDYARRDTRDPTLLRIFQNTAPRAPQQVMGPTR